MTLAIGEKKAKFDANWVEKAKPQLKMTGQLIERDAGGLFSLSELTFAATTSSSQRELAQNDRARLACESSFARTTPNESGVTEYDNIKNRPLYRLLRGECMTCYFALGNNINPFLFCKNSATLGYDPFGLETKQDCDDAYEAAMKAANQAGLKCLEQAIGDGLIGGVIGGVVGIVGGGVGGGIIAGPPGYCQEQERDSGWGGGRERMYRFVSLPPVREEGAANEAKSRAGSSKLFKEG